MALNVYVRLDHDDVIRKVTVSSLATTSGLLDSLKEELDISDSEEFIVELKEDPIGYILVTDKQLHDIKDGSQIRLRNVTTSTPKQTNPSLPISTENDLAMRKNHIW